LDGERGDADDIGDTDLTNLERDLERDLENFIIPEFTTSIGTGIETRQRRERRP
jgi:hypothetical protein